MRSLLVSRDAKRPGECFSEHKVHCFAKPDARRFAKMAMSSKSIAHADEASSMKYRHDASLDVAISAVREPIPQDVRFSSAFLQAQSASECVDRGVLPTHSLARRARKSRKTNPVRQSIRFQTRHPRKECAEQDCPVPVGGPSLLEARPCCGQAKKDRPA